jgi:hypothetical protein
MKKDLPLEPVFFVDRDLGGNVFHARLKDAGIIFERHEDHFVHNTPDHAWIEEVGKRGWYILTRDKMIRHRLEEMNAVEKNNVGMFVIIGKCSHAELASNFVLSFQKVSRFIKNNSRPFIAKIYRSDPQKKEKENHSGYIAMWKSFRENE